MSNSVSPDGFNFISLPQAVAMTSLYRKERDSILKPELVGQNILPICETFDRKAFDYLLGEGGCTGLRFYLGMDDKLNVHIIAVGINEKGDDMLPLMTSAPGDPGDQIVENGQRCPLDCPPPSPLNE
ncbi:hypothetical protein [Ferruginibacter sp.]